MGSHRQSFRLTEIKIEVTQECDLRCIHCSSEGTATGPVAMSSERVVAILGQAAEMGVKEVAFSGGEPLLWAGLDEAVPIAAASGMEVLVYTSGNVDDFAQLAGRLAQNGVRRLILSIFAANPETHDAVTQVQGSYKRTLAAVAEANRLGLTTEFHFVPMRPNYQQLLDVAHLAIDRGVCRVSVLRFVPHGRGKAHSALALTGEENLELQRMVHEARKRVDLRTGSPYNFLLVNDKGQCHAAQNGLVVTPDLRIYPCDGFKRIRAEQLVGVDDYSGLDRWPLAECWEKSPYLEAVRQHLMTPFAEPCAGCENLRKCGSGCLAQKVIAYGRLVKAPDPMCLAGKRLGAE